MCRSVSPLASHLHSQASRSADENRKSKLPSETPAVSQLQGKTGELDNYPLCDDSLYFLPFELVRHYSRQCQCKTLTEKMLNVFWKHKRETQKWMGRR